MIKEDARRTSAAIDELRSCSIAQDARAARIDEARDEVRDDVRGTTSASVRASVSSGQFGRIDVRVTVRSAPSARCAGRRA